MTKSEMDFIGSMNMCDEISNKAYQKIMAHCEEQQPSEDCISRQAVMNFIRGLTRWCVRSEDGKFNNIGLLYDDVMFGLGWLPSVTPQPKTGHWILQPSNKEQDERDFIWWKCSKCGQVIYSEAEQDRREFHAFCGRCGAKMIEPQALAYADQDTLMSAT